MFTLLFSERERGGGVRIEGCEERERGGERGLVTSKHFIMSDLYADLISLNEKDKKTRAGSTEIFIHNHCAVPYSSAIIKLIQYQFNTYCA